MFRDNFVSRFRKMASGALLSIISVGISDAQAPSLTFTKYAVPGAGSGLTSITSGPDGALWFSNSNTKQIGRITTAGMITLYATINAPLNITSGPDAALWFTEHDAHQIGRISTAGAITEYSIPCCGAPEFITTGPDGALWFTEYPGKIGRISTGGAVNEYPLPAPSAGAFGITVGPDGALWFADEFSNEIGRITTGGLITEYVLPPASYLGPAYIAAGSDGALWFNECGDPKIGKTTTDGVVTQYPAPSNCSAAMTAGPDGAIWFVDADIDSGYTNFFSRITTAGVITSYAAPIPNVGPPYHYGLISLANGPDGALWFLDNFGNVVRAALSSSLVIATTSLPGGATGIPYSARLAAQGGAGSYTWSIVSGNLPPGLALNPTTGVISGSPTGGGSTFTIGVIDSSSPPQSTTQALSIAISSPSSQISSPPPGGQLASTTVTFTWNSVAGADGYWLDVGTALAQGNICASGQITKASFTCPGIPTTASASTVYVQLWTHVNGAWLNPQRYTYIPPVGGSPAYALISSPTPGTQLASTTVTFIWNAAAGADMYWLDVGNSVAHGDISAGSTSATSKTVSGLPCDGRTIYVQLWAFVAGTWLTPQRYTYTAPSSCGPGSAQIVTPVPGTPLVGATVTFTWTSVFGADMYWLDVGNSVAQGDISAGSTSATSKTVGSLPCDGRTIYVQLWTHLAGAWQTPQRYSYLAATSCSPGLAQIITPAPGTPLAESTVLFAWNQVLGADMYWLDVGNSVAQGDISAGSMSATSKTVSGLPCDGRMIYVQLWTLVTGTWLTPQRYTYTASTTCTPVASFR
jgi:virginiamycin B lyase